VINLKTASRRSYMADRFASAYGTELRTGTVSQIDLRTPDAGCRLSISAQQL